jgi:hypothetical protein
MHLILSLFRDHGFRVRLHVGVFSRATPVKDSIDFRSRNHEDIQLRFPMELFAPPGGGLGLGKAGYEIAVVEVSQFSKVYSMQ